MKTKVLDSLQTRNRRRYVIHISSLNSIEITQGDAAEYQERRSEKD